MAVKPRILCIGVPSDEGSPFAGGSRFGPRSIREHSLRFTHGMSLDTPMSHQTTRDAQYYGNAIRSPAKACGLVTSWTR